MNWKNSFLQKNTTRADLQQALCKNETEIKRRQELEEEVCPREAEKRTSHLLNLFRLFISLFPIFKLGSSLLFHFAFFIPLN